MHYVRMIFILLQFYSKYGNFFTLIYNTITVHLQIAFHPQIHVRLNRSLFCNEKLRNKVNNYVINF